MEKFAHLPDLRTVQPERLVKYRISEDRFTAEVLLPGFAYTDFDQKIGGKPSLQAIAQLFYSARFSNHGLWIESEANDDRIAFFVVSQSYNFTKEMNGISLSTVYDSYRPLRAIIYCTYLGRSSLTMATELYDATTGRLLGTNYTNVVQMNTELRQPAPILHIPKDVTAQLADLKHTPIPRWDVPTVPKSAFRYSLQAVFSEADHNQHINQTVYTKWCTDGASMGAIGGALPRFHKPIESYPLKSFVSHYKKELYIGDKVDVFVWEDTSVNNCLQFVMRKEDTVVYLARMELYASDIEPARM